MSVGKIALGVFLGNLATAILSLIVLAFWAHSERVQNANDSVNARLEAYERQQAVPSDTPVP